VALPDGQQSLQNLQQLATVGDDAANLVGFIAGSGFFLHLLFILDFIDFTALAMLNARWTIFFRNLLRQAPQSPDECSAKIIEDFFQLFVFRFGFRRQVVGKSPKNAVAQERKCVDIRILFTVSLCWDALFPIRPQRLGSYAQCGTQLFQSLVASRVANAAIVEFAEIRPARLVNIHPLAIGVNVEPVVEPASLQGRPKVLLERFFSSLRIPHSLLLILRVAWKLLLTL
jgi:hypothetical protein